MNAIAILFGVILVVIVLADVVNTLVTNASAVSGFLASDLEDRQATQE